MLLAVIFGVALLSAVSCQIAAGNVAFTATFTADQVISANEILKFNNVILNQGNGYDNKTGVFTSPEDGFFLFLFNVLSSSGYESWLDLYKNDAIIVGAFARQKNDYDSAANFAAVQLVTGDRVYVKAVRTAYLYGRAAERYATFTGFMIGAVPM